MIRVCRDIVISVQGCQYYRLWFKGSDSRGFRVPLIRIRIIRN